MVYFSSFIFRKNETIAPAARVPNCYHHMILTAAGYGPWVWQLLWQSLWIKVCHARVIKYIDAFDTKNGMLQLKNNISRSWHNRRNDRGLVGSKQSCALLLGYSVAAKNLGIALQQWINYLQLISALNNMPFLPDCSNWAYVFLRISFGCESKKKPM